MARTEGGPAVDDKNLSVDRWRAGRRQPRMP